LTGGNWSLGYLIIQTPPRHSGRDRRNPDATDGKSSGG